MAKKEVAEDLESLFDDLDFDEEPVHRPVPQSNEELEEEEEEDDDFLLDEEWEEELDIIDEEDLIEELGGDPRPQNQASSIPNMLCPSPLHKIRIEKHVFEDILLMAKAVNELAKEQFDDEELQFEVYAYLLGDREEFNENEPSLVKEIFIPTHSAEEGHVDVGINAIMELRDYIESNNLSVLGWTHSHGQYDAYSSETDDQNHRMILNETSNYVKHNEFDLKYIYEITVNTREDRFGVLLTQFPCTHIAQENDCEIEYIGEGYDEFEKEERYNQIKGIVRSRVNLIRPADDLTPEEIKARIREEILANFVNRLFQSKDLISDQMSSEEEESFELIQGFVEKYDKLLMDSAEEAVTVTADTLLKLMGKMKKSI